MFIIKNPALRLRLGTRKVVLTPLVRKLTNFKILGKYAMSNVINKKNKFQRIYAVDAL